MTVACSNGLQARKTITPAETIIDQSFLQLGDGQSATSNGLIDSFVTLTSDDVDLTALIFDVAANSTVVTFTGQIYCQAAGDLIEKATGGGTLNMSTTQIDTSYASRPFIMN